MCEWANKSCIVGNMVYIPHTLAVRGLLLIVVAPVFIVNRCVISIYVDGEVAEL